MSVIDGGSFKCYSDKHKTIFETTDPGEWEAHINDGKHTETGSSVCAICGNPTNYEHKRQGIKAVCKKCKEAINE
jgi:hypothetical protein